MPLQVEQRFRELLEAAPDAIIEVDQSGKIVLLNQMTERLFGYRRDELLGRPLDILIPEHLHAAQAEIGFSLEGRRSDGTRFPVEISLSPVTSGEGFSVTAIVRDISESTPDEFRDKARRADRLRSEFLRGMSHELRTPLHTIIGFSGLLQEEIKGPLNADQKLFVAHIQRDSSHLLELIDQILDLSRIEAGQLELRRQTIDMCEAIGEVVASIRPLALAKAIRIETRLDTGISLDADLARFKQILFNLLSNAVKFSSEGGLIRIDSVCCGALVGISVSDTGIGIAAERQESVFDRYHQVRSNGPREAPGLGLAITRALVEQHGGRIWLESQPGKGSCFTFTIPSCDVVEDVAAMAAYAG